MSKDTTKNRIFLIGLFWFLAITPMVLCQIYGGGWVFAYIPALFGYMHTGELLGEIK